MAPSPTDGPLPDDALWTFAVETYARPDMAALCLRLQDEHGLDVDVLLACLWLASRGAALDEATLTRALDAAAGPRARVLELRVLRRALGSERTLDPRWQAPYAHVQAAELAAERIELEHLQAALASLSCAAADEPPTLARASLRRYAARRGAASCDPLLASLVEHAWPRPAPARD